MWQNVLWRKHLTTSGATSQFSTKFGTLSFLFIDLVFYQTAAHRGGGAAKLVVPGLVVLLITYFYSGDIKDKGLDQAGNLLIQHQGIYPMPLSWDAKVGRVRKLTNNSDKVYFAALDDFYYYYYGNYTPEGHYFPYSTWVFKKEQIDFMQGLLDKGYYIVSPICLIPKNQYPLDEILSDLRYDNGIAKDGFNVVWNGKHSLEADGPHLLAIKAP